MFETSDKPFRAFDHSNIDSNFVIRISSFPAERQGDRRDSNPRRPGPQPGALPTELRPPCVRLCNYFYRVECDSQPTDVRSVTAVPVLSGGSAHYERLCLTAPRNGFNVCERGLFPIGVIGTGPNSDITASRTGGLVCTPMTQSDSNARCRS